MKNFFRNLGNKFAGLMAGRYGMDELSKSLNIAALVCLLLSVFPWLRIFYGVAFLLWAAAIFRCFSRNLSKRRGERSKYLALVRRIKAWFARSRQRWADRKTHRYFRCSQCKTTLRIPRGKGTLKIRCPKCGSEIIRKS